MSKLSILMLVWLAAVPCAGGAANSGSPKISDVAVTLLSPTSAVIRWKTDVACDSLAFWSPTTDDYIAYGQKSALQDESGTTTHAVSLNDLTPGAIYWFGVRSRAISGAPPGKTRAAFWEGDETNNKFKMPDASKTGALDFKVVVSGPHHVIQGYELYVNTVGTLTSGTSSFAESSYKLVVSDLPPYTTVRWALKDLVGDGTISTTNHPGDTLSLWSPVTSPVEFVTNSGGTTPPGTYQARIRFSVTDKSGKSVQKVIPWTIKVDPASKLRKAAPAAFPPIPKLSVWQSNMRTYGEKWCKQTGAPYDQFVWFYDGIHVYQQIRSYSHDDRWNSCVQSLLADYRDNYVIKNKGGIQKHMMFAEGLYTDYVSTHSQSSSAAITMMAPQAGASIYGFTIGFMREQALALEVWRLAEKLGTHSVWTKPTVAALVGMAEQVAHDESPYYQPYMCGLLAQSLITYYEDGHQDDIRIPLAIRDLADALYRNAYNKAPTQPGGFFYSSFRFSVGLTDEGGGTELRGLNLLIAPMYAWLYKYTGDTRYQIEGDKIWSDAFLADPGNTVGWTGKNFSQQYRWSFDFVKWRTQP